MIIDVLMEPFVKQARPEQNCQFLRHGYFCLDRTGDRLVFNRVVPLKDTWSKRL
ncbi:hypothetical protein [Paenibacillus sp. V4I9]|uniref:hypothetical protein n=1 Tax=Paenibacillus sp. V4I9 TaxID=3042308 RepID=UPI0027D8A37C|nr:hypothetical protein [Paenibacillus sp. V4I9]